MNSDGGKVTSLRMSRKNGVGKLIRNTLSVIVLVFIDLVSLYVIIKIARYLRLQILPEIYAGFPSEIPFRNFWRVWWIFPTWTFFFWYEGLYTKRFSLWDEVLALWKASFFSTVGIFTLVSVGKLGFDISRTTVILTGLLSIAALPPVRFIAKRSFRRFGLFTRRVLILGAGSTGQLMLRALRKEPNYGYDVVGFLDDDPAKVGSRIDGLKVHRGVNRAVSYLRACNITDVIIAMPGIGKEKVTHLINSLQHKVERIMFVPDIHGIAVIGTSLQHFFHEQAFALELKNNLARPVNILIKRCFDIVVGLLLLPFVLFSMFIIGILIKFDSPGPVIFSQERLGKRGSTFRCMKFRTMFIDAEERLTAILGSDPDARQEWEKYYKLKDDPRVTRVGKLLRAASLDELPQLFHVLSGTMSLVGPRPVTQNEISIYYKEAADLCFSVPPGITGLWQVTGRSGISYDYRVGLDSWYVRNWNVWLDIVILFKTAAVVIRREGAW
jgi:undecaprenyl-phosphate galactose phosphotransferase